ncbi:MAG: crossover junction endodeoxyribonuclease RuvC [Gammaproteobacteria bacterium]|nr:MAG: crossover junction endodeoxyribonuclease RuvC [Gammaproteobacteria bacterium]
MPVILGIDPGSVRTGYGVIETLAGGRSRYIASGFIRVEGQTLAERLNHVFNGVTQLIDMYHPQEAAIEQVFMARNADSALKLGQARGAAMVALAQKAIPVSEYATKKAKQAVVGSGRADKAQVQAMIQALFKLERTPQADAADALAIALCHAHTLSSLVRMGRVSRGTARGRWREGDLK